MSDQRSETRTNQRTSTYEEKIELLAQQIELLRSELEKTQAQLEKVEHRLLLSQKLSEIQRNALRLASPYHVHSRIALLTLFEYSLDDDEVVRYECVNALARIPDLPGFELPLRPVILHLRGMVRDDKSLEVSQAAKQTLLKFGVDLDARKSANLDDMRWD
jgi:uncharacterized small protein (DUF1192 family)